MGQLKYYNIYLDGIDKCGKDLINTYINYLANFKYLNKSRGLITMMAYSEKFNRKYDYDLESMKHSVHFLIDVDKDDWAVRCRNTNEPSINYEYDTALFNKAYNKLEEAGYKVYKFNSSVDTPYAIACKIIAILNSLNKEEA